MTFAIGDQVWVDPAVADLYGYDEELGAFPIFPEGSVVPIAAEIIGTGWSSLDGASVEIEWPDKYVADGVVYRTVSTLVLDPNLVVNVSSATMPGHDVGALGESQPPAEEAS